MASLLPMRLQRPPLDPNEIGPKPSAGQPNGRNTRNRPNLARRRPPKLNSSHLVPSKLKQTNKTDRLSL